MSLPRYAGRARRDRLPRRRGSNVTYGSRGVRSRVGHQWLLRADGTCCRRYSYRARDSRRVSLTAGGHQSQRTQGQPQPEGSGHSRHGRQVLHLHATQLRQQRFPQVQTATIPCGREPRRLTHRRHLTRSDGDDGDEGLEPAEVIGVAGVQGGPMDMCGRGDQQVHRSGPRLAS